MAEINNMENNNLTEFSSGLHSDSSPLHQPKGSQRFALNMVNDMSVAGDQNNAGFNTTKNNEGSNELYINLTPGYIPIGKVYIENNETLIFSVKEDNTNSEIGIMNDFGKYTVIISTPVLNFKVEHQIQATYRLRRGCERVVYWVDDFNPPRFVNIDNIDSFKDDSGDNFVAQKFTLIKTPTMIPKFEEIEVMEGSGSLNPGSYTISIQYVDEDYNSTNWLNGTDSIVIYNSLLSDSYHNIAGSFFSYAPISNGDNPLSGGKTSKGIRVRLSNLDQSFPFYRLGFSIADSGTGFATKAVVSEVISTKNDAYIFSSLTNTTEVALEELSFEKALINRAKTVEQHENLLLLGNTTGWEGNLCKFQKYASKIKADCIVVKSSATSVGDAGNIKNPTLNVADIRGGTGAGYMPGEVYSFGIVYILKSGFITPVFHIPGKASDAIGSDSLLKTIYHKEPGVDTFPMDNKRDEEGNVTNACQSSIYPNIGSCNNSDYWGFDAEGRPLLGQPIRHHKFPERKDIGKPLIESSSGTDITSVKFLQLTTYFRSNKSFDFAESEYPSGVKIDYTYRVSNESTDRTNSISFQASDLFSFDGIESTVAKEVVGVTSKIANLDGTVSISITSAKLSYWDKVLVDDGSGTMVERWQVVEQDLTGNGSFVTYTTPPTGLDSTTSETGIKNYSTNKLGIQFSGIEFPTSADLGIDDEVVGYYIVRNERTEDNKLIVDSGVMTPTYQASSDQQVIGYASYIAPSLLLPQSGGNGYVNNMFWNIITPRFKFDGIKLREGLYTIEQQGIFNKTSQTISRTRYSDVMDGSSYAQAAAEGGDFSSKNLDEGNPAKSPYTGGLDGWCFRMACRDSILSFKAQQGFIIKPEDQSKIYTLRGMEYEPTIIDPTTCIYNSQTDNINQIIELKTNSQATYTNGVLPYVSIKKKVSEPYATFFTLPYYKLNTNVQPTSNNVCAVFNGDAYISSLRYNSVVKYQNKACQLLAKATLSAWVAWAVVIVSVVVGVVVSIFTWGAGTVAAVAGIGAALTLVGTSIWAATSIISDLKFIENYENAYKDGLYRTVSDKWIKGEYDESNPEAYHISGTYSSPSDDELQYAADCLTDVWFESEVNMGLRVKGSDASFLGSPGKIESGQTQGDLIKSFKDGGKGIKDWFDDSQTITWLMTRDVPSPFGAYRTPITALENFANNKCLTPDLARNHGKKFTGLAMGEAYILNPDLQRRGGQTTYFHLPITYDCCSDCAEDFPHRFHWSEQSFQEELVDNYSMFKENNYRDLDGETGEIINIFKIKEQLYIHTKEALWYVPKNYQERITDQIVSFIGTGSLYDIPPRKIVEGQSGMSAGLWHRESALLCEHGYFFVCEKQRKIYHFNGQQLVAISDYGISDWFKDNMELSMAADYRAANGKDYNYNDNPSNRYGCGFVSTYDSYKGRVLFTKKDFKFGSNVIGANDFELCVRNGVLVISRNHNQKINNITTASIPETDWSEYHQETVRPISGWRYLGIEDCRLKFERDIKRERKENRWEQLPPIFKDADYLVFYYYFNQNNGRDLDTRTTLYLNNQQWGTPIGWCRNGNADPYMQWSGDNTGYGLESILINVKRIRQDFPDIEDFHFTTEAWWFGERNDGNMNMRAVAYKGGTMHLVGYEFVPVDSSTVLQGDFNFPTLNITRQQGSCISDPTTTGIFVHDIVNGTVYDINNPIEPEPEEPKYEETEVTVSYVDIDYMYLEGEEVHDAIQHNNSWTLSYDLDSRKWISWHSYLPSMYLFVADKFYSWMYGNSGIWKHNKLGHYQTFYGKLYPFIIDYISLSSPLQTRIFDAIQLICNAEKYDSGKDEFIDIDTVFFNKLIAYNSRQCTGELNIKVKNENLDEYYLQEQINGISSNEIIADKNEKTWSLNAFRDIRTDYNQTIFDSSPINKQNEYFIDKVLNISSIDFNKSWEELEILRDKYLEIRLIFDKLDSIKLSLDFSSENEKMSVR